MTDDKGDAKRPRLVRKADVAALANAKRSVALTQRPLPRRVYHARDQMLSAFWAGMGFTGEEIAERLGGTTGQRVRAMLHKCGIRMRRRPADDELIAVRCRRSDRKRLYAEALNRGVNPDEFALAILRNALAQSPEFLASMADAAVADNEGERDA